MKTPRRETEALLGIVADQLRNDRWTPQARLVGIETTTSRFAGAMHLPSAVRGRLAIVL